MFAFVLTFQSGAAGRTYAAYGGAFVAISVAWLWLVEHQRPTHWDILGVGIVFVGMSVILI
ncbi:MAG: YnfA family protein [Aggregatilineales bacterium]